MALVVSEQATALVTLASTAANTALSALRRWRGCCGWHATMAVY